MIRSVYAGKLQRQLFTDSEDRECKTDTQPNLHHKVTRPSAMQATDISDKTEKP